MSKKFLLTGLIIFLLFNCIDSSFAKPESLYDKRISLAKKLIADDKGREAAFVLQPLLLQSQPTYDTFILAAQSAAEMDDPNTAYDNYTYALEIAKDATERHVALFGLAKMQFWLDQYVRSADTYECLLRDQLNRVDYELALAGLVKSLAYLDFARLAYALIPCQLQYTSPNLVVAAAQTTLWSDWADITKCILCSHQSIIKKIPPHSPLAKDLMDVQWQMDLATWPNVLTPSFYYSEDTEQFNERRISLDYTHYWCHLFQTSLGMDHIIYSQHSNELVGRGIYLRQILQPRRDLIVSARIEPTNFSGWHPFLWNANINYRPNDYIGINLLALKELVKTFPAFTLQIVDKQVAASTQLHPWPYLILDGSVSRLYFSDNNQRNGYYVDIQGLVVPTYGMSLIIRQREYTDHFQSPSYFSPDKYRERAILIRVGSKAGSVWHYYVDAGAGRQWIVPTKGAPSETSPTHQWGFGINGPINKNVMVSAYYANVYQASAFSNASGYRYRYGGVAMNILL